MMTPSKIIAYGLSLLLFLCSGTTGLSQENDVLCTAYSPERDTPMKLSCSQTEDYSEIKIPELNTYEILVIKGG